MSRYATDYQDPVQECVPSPPLPPDHVLNSGAVLFPGAFDQHGCHLIVFPVDGQARLSELGKAEVVDFINYFLRLHNMKQEKQSLASVVADLRQASIPTSRFIAETLLLLEQHQRTVHSVYMVLPKKKDAAKLLLKLLAPSKSHTASFKRVFLKEIPELSNYIDRSQLTASLGGYFVYSHHSWVAFIKEMDAFVQDFISVVQRLPSCISMLQGLSRLPLPTTFNELQHFCSTNEARFQKLRRELGLDELLRHCESVLEKLRHPEMEPCYQAMAGTALFTHTAFDMLQNYSRITAAVEKVELLWQQAFSSARLQLQVFQLRDSALQITEQIETLLQEKLQPYKIEIAKDTARAVILASQFEASIHTPAMALVRCAEDVIHTLTEVLPLDSQSRENWVLDLERLKEKLHSAVNVILQTLRAVCNYHQYYNKASKWYTLVLCENFLQELLSGVDAERAPIQQQQMRTWGSIPAWRHKLSTFLKKSPSPSMEELLHLDHLSNVIPDDEVQENGKQMSQRCMTLRKLLISSGPVSVSHLQLALQWQYELLRSSRGNQISVNSAAESTPISDLGREVPHVSEQALSTAVSGMTSGNRKPLSISSFDSGFDGAANSHPEAWGEGEEVEVLCRLAGTRNSLTPAAKQSRIHKENIPSVSCANHPTDVFDFDSVGDSPRSGIQIIPKITVDSLNFEIKVKRTAALPNNPWLSLPVDDLESSYTVTVTPNPTPQKRNPQFYDPSDSCTDAIVSHNHQEQYDPIVKEVQGLDDPVLSPLENILSSTITDESEKSISTTEGIPTLLWDSYDLHQDEDALDGINDLSLKDWDVKEQEGLKEVEKILDRADEILEEEENVLAQEAELDALLSSDASHNHWPMYYEDQAGVMSSSAWIEAGVLCIDDPLDSAQSDLLNEHASLREMGLSEDEPEASYSKPDLLTELHNINVLDELIVEENLKIHELRHSQENPNIELTGSKPLPTEVSDVHKGRNDIQPQIEMEKRQVEKLENCLDKEETEKASMDSTIKNSIMEKARAENEDKVLCDELLSDNCNRLKPYSASLDHNSNACKPECIPTETAPDFFNEARPLDTVPHSTNSEAYPLKAKIDLNEPPGEADKLPQQTVCERELFGFCKAATIYKLEAASASEVKPDEAFDPGGKSTLPLYKLTEGETNSTGPQVFVNPDLQDKVFDSPPEEVTPTMNHHLVQNPNVKEHRNNNNNNLPEEQGLLLNSSSEMSIKDKERTSLAPASLSHSDWHQTQKIGTDVLPHQQLAELPTEDDQHLEFDPDGTEELNKSHPEKDQVVNGVRIPGPGSPGIQAQLNSIITQVSYFKTPIVLDTGSGLMKAGFADRDHPNVIFPTIIGMPKYEEIMNGNLEKETYIGHDAQRMRGVLTLKHPIKNGIIQNWDDMEKIWHHTFQQLCVDPGDHPVLLTEAAMNPLENRQRMVEIMFECFNVPLSYVAMQAVLALYAAGRSTGVVFDSGDGVSHSVPVFEGYCLPHAVQRFPLAGADVTMHLKKLLQEQGVCMRTTAEMEIVREMKEKCCCVALNYESELTGGSSSCREMYYTMPDGQIVTLSTERFRAPEILFKPTLIGRDHYGMHESIFKSILSSDIDLRRCLLRNIVLSGGNTLLVGLPERLQAEIKCLLGSANTVDGVRVTSPADRDFLVWRGGAVLANLPTFSCAWISREEYEEYGPQIVFRKCF